MEDDIRELLPLVGKSPPIISESKSQKSRSKSTTAKTKKKKKSTDEKSKSKSTTTAKSKQSKSSAPISSDPKTLTVQIPSQTTLIEPESGKPVVVKPSISEYLREIIEDPIIPSPTETNGKSSTKKRTGKSSTGVKKQPKSSTTAIATATASKLKKKEKEEEVEEKKKRRERLLVSPFEYLQIRHVPENSTEFHDDISLVTLPKPLRDLEAKAARKLEPTEESSQSEISLAPEIQSSSPAESSKSSLGVVPPEPLPVIPGWSRKSKPERIPNSKDKEQEQASALSSHTPDKVSATTPHNDSTPSLVGTKADAKMSQPETSEEQKSNLPPNKNPRKKQETSPPPPLTLESINNNLDKNIGRQDIDPIPQIDSAQASSLSNRTPKQYLWIPSSMTRQKTKGTQRTLNDNAESGNVASTNLIENNNGPGVQNDHEELRQPASFWRSSSRPFRLSYWPRKTPKTTKTDRQDTP